MLIKKFKIKNNIKSKTRLRKIADFFNGDEVKGKFLSVFKNPTSTEIQEAKKESEYNSVRGVITASGDLYCWNGDVLHKELPKSLNIDVENGSFRFAAESGGWIFDLYNNWTFVEGCRKMIEYEPIIRRFSGLNSELSFFFGKDNAYKEYNDLNIGLPSSQYFDFENFEEVHEFVEAYDQKK